MTQIIFLSMLLSVWQNPTPVYVGPGDQEIDVVISDGEGGAAIIWWDDVTRWNYMQVIDSAGNLKWGTEGVPILMMPDTSTRRPDVFRDDDGNYWITLEILSGAEVFVQKMSPDGERLLGDRGVDLCTAEGERSAPFICKSGDGVIVVWEDDRDGWSDLYMQRVDSEGNLKWQPDGLPLRVLTGIEAAHSQNIVHDDNGGGIIVYWTSLGEFPPGSIYTQRVDSLGQLLWGDSGIFVEEAELSKWQKKAFTDNEGGMIFRYYTSGYRYQRLNGNGEKVWDSAGVVVGFNTYRRLRSSDLGPNGIYTANGDAIEQIVYANRLTADGITACGTSGVEIWNAHPGSSTGDIIPAVTHDGIIVWRDLYDELGWYEQQGILAQRVDTLCNTLWGEEVVVAGTEGGNPHAVATYDKAAIVIWQTGDIYAAHLDSLGNISGIVEESIPTITPLQLELVSGNLVNGSVRLRLSIPQGTLVNVAVYDASGRLVNTLINHNLSEGIHEITWNEVDQIGYKVSTGIYFVRVAALGRAVTEKIVLIK